jgi:hypothetical protein
MKVYSKLRLPLPLLLDNNIIKYEGCPENSCTAVIVVRVIDRKTWIIYHLKGRSVLIEKTTEKNV